ncbi:hypothetical protein ACFRCI_16455 [Streptomyces sp. NPDC056638]|uniref:hypothetical protein n=1 Tax=Streptomyces sp. NPDC056638 TaxID=3345887 RepID=UPI003687D19E
MDGVSYDDVPTECLEPPTVVEQTLGPRRPSGWVLAKASGRGPGRGVVHAVDGEEAPAGAPVLTLAPRLPRPPSGLLPGLVNIDPAALRVPSATVNNCC